MSKRGTGGRISKRAAIREALATLAHEQWSGWMGWLYQFGEWQLDGRFIVNAERAQRWRRQMGTPYMELSEDERDNDRREADRVLAILAWYGVTFESEEDGGGEGEVLPAMPNPDGQALQVAVAVVDRALAAGGTVALSSLGLVLKGRRKA